MKKFLSIILAITLCISLLPIAASANDAAPADGALTLTFGEGGITEFISSTGRATFSIKDGAFAAEKIQTRAIQKNHKSSHTAYAAFAFTSDVSGTFALKMKTDNSTIYSSDVSIYFLKESECLKSSELNGTYAVPSYFLGESHAITYRIGHFNFSTATNGKYEPVLKTSDQSPVRVTLEKGVNYYILVYCDDLTQAKIVEGENTFKVDSYQRQEFYLSGIRFEPVTEMVFNKDVISIPEKTSAPGDWKISVASGWSVDTDLARTTNYTTQSIGQNFLLLSLARASKYYEPWSTFGVGLNNNSKAIQSTFSLKTTFPLSEGYYRIKMLGGKNDKGTKVELYTDDRFAGWYDCYDASTSDAKLDSEEKILNTVYISPDEDGTAKVFIASEGATMNLGDDLTDNDEARTNAIISKITFEYLGTEKPLSATPDKIVIEEYPETLEAESSAPISAYVLMKDGSKLHINGLERTVAQANGYYSCAQEDTNNYIKIETSDNLGFTADFEGKNVKNGVFTNASGNATGTVTAVSGGDATVTVTAKVDGVELTPVTATIAIPEDEIKIGEEVTDTKVNVGIVALGGGSVTTSLSEAVSEVEIGTKVTAEATAIEGYEFAYWANSNGKVLSANAKETFTINVNTSIKAYFEKAVSETDTTAPVYFYNGNGEKLSTESVEKGKTFGEIAKPAATLTGFAFDKWSIADSAIINDITRAVALFKDAEDTYTVKVDGADYATGKKYGDTVTVSATESDFTCWKLGDKVISYAKDFTLDVYGNISLAKVCDGAVDAIPTVVLDKVGGEYFLTYEVPAGYTKLEAGILFAESGTPTIGSFNSKATEKTGSGQFTAKAAVGEAIARGYIIFRDASGGIRVIYAE